MRTWLVVAMMSGCASSATVECDFGITCPAGTLCDAMHQGCIVQGQLDACVDKGERETCTTPVIDDGVCDLGVCFGARCGDGVRAESEICDGQQFSGDSNCNQVGFYEDLTLTCSPSCTLDTSMCSARCGDGVINGPELCDDSLPPATCVDQGFGTGFLQCSLSCGPDTRECIPFGWRAIDFSGPVAAIHGTADNNVWVVGGAGMVRRFDGAAWMPIDIGACTNSDLTQVFVLSETDAIVTDASGVIRISATGCTKDDVAPNIAAVWAASPTDIYVGSLGGLWRFTGAWAMVDATPSRALWGRAGNDIYRGDPSAGTVLRWDGQTWTNANAPTVAAIHGIWGNAEETFVGAATAAGTARVFRHRLGSWTSPLLTKAGFDSAARATLGAGSTTRNVVVAYAGNRGAVLAGDGIGWGNLDAPYFDQRATPFLAPDGTLFLAVNGSTRLFVFEGTSRVSTKPPPSGFTNIAVAGPDSAFVPLPASNQLWSWNGNVWAQEQDGDFGSGRMVDDVTIDALGNVLVVGATGVRQRTGFGTFSAAVQVVGTKLAAQSYSDFFVQTAASTIVHRVGAVSHPFTFGEVIHDFVSITPTLAIAVGTNGFISHCSGNATWVTQPTPPGTGHLLRVHAASATDAHAIASNSLLRYDGVSWMSMPVPTTELLRDVYGATGDLFVATDAGLFHHDGTRWNLVDTGGLTPVSLLAGRGSSIFWIELDAIDQLLRTRPW